MGLPSSEWLVGSHGRVVMTLLAVFPVLPMCLLTRMRSVRSLRSTLEPKPCHCVIFLVSWLRPDTHHHLMYAVHCRA